MRKQEGTTDSEDKVKQARGLSEMIEKMGKKSNGKKNRSMVM